jgi:hypothetical protein
MKIDLYTKSILTVIAAALVWTCVQNAVIPRTVSAQGTQRVVIVSGDGQAADVVHGRLAVSAGGY